MEMESDEDSFYKRCSGCLTPGRKLSLLTDKKGIQMFSLLLDNLDLEKYNIPLCYECNGRLNSTIRFKEQVRKAQRFLKRFPENQAKSLSKLSLTRTEKYEWKPNIAISRVTQVPPQLIKQNNLRPKKTQQYVSQKKIGSQTANIDPECVIVIPDLDDDKTQTDIDSLTAERDQPKFDTLDLDRPQSKSIRNIQYNEKEQRRLKSLSVEINRIEIETQFEGTDELNVEENKQSTFDRDMKNQDQDLNILDIEINVPDLNTQNDEKDDSNFDNSNIEKSEPEFDEFNEEVVQDIKIEIEETDLNVKREGEEKSEIEIMKQQKEIDYGFLDPVTKCEFNESDDEPLNVVKDKKKEDILITRKHKRGRRSGVISNKRVLKRLEELNIPPGHIERVVLTWEEVEEERQKALLDKKYTSNQFKCELCVIGFNHQMKLDAHNIKHSPDVGSLECQICKTRFKNNISLLCHLRRHTARWRCCHCGILYSRASVAADHISREHKAPQATHACRLCSHTAVTLGKLRIHMLSHAEQQHCDQCGKAFRDKYALKNHLFIHEDRKDFICEVCDKRFRSKQTLEIHSLTHKASLALYCAECDVNFKHHLSYYQHMKYSLRHVRPEDLKFACEFCPKRFSRPRRLEEHRLSIHLKLAPHKCEEKGCNFSSAARAALRTHFRLVHRNKRLVRNYVCHNCGKAFQSKKILDGHIRTHTGERIYKCTVCPSSHAHASALYHHIRLKHKALFELQRKERMKKRGEDWESDENSDFITTKKAESET